jgi:hypothetical protein
MDTIYLIVESQEDYYRFIDTFISTHPTRQQAEAEAARLDLEAAWAINQPDYDGGRVKHYVFEIPFSLSTPVDKSIP